MNESNHDRKLNIDPGHDATGPSSHDKDQLRRRLLQMILKSEAERRARDLTSKRSSSRAKPRPTISTVMRLAVFDPDEQMDANFTTGQTPTKRA